MTKQQCQSGNLGRKNNDKVANQVTNHIIAAHGVVDSPLFNTTSKIM